MYYGYDICPKCKDKLIQRKECRLQQEEFELNSGKYCLNCGNELRLACVGEVEVDDVIYQIILGEIYDFQKKDAKFMYTLMEIGGFNKLSFEEKLVKSNSIAFKGTFENTYMAMELLDDIGATYTVIPSFDYTRYIYNDLCPTCGKKAVTKTKELENDSSQVLYGLFCECCNEWVMVTSIDKIRIDETVYNLNFSLNGLNDKEKDELLILINELPNQSENNDGVVVKDKAKVIYDILLSLKKNNVDYVIYPDFPYEIVGLEVADEALLSSILQASKEVGGK